MIWHPQRLKHRSPRRRFEWTEDLLKHFWRSLWAPSKQVLKVRAFHLFCQRSFGLFGQDHHWSLEFVSNLCAINKINLFTYRQLYMMKNRVIKTPSLHLIRSSWILARSIKMRCNSYHSNKHNWFCTSTFMCYCNLLLSSGQLSLVCEFLSALA